MDKINAVANLIATLVAIGHASVPKIKAIHSMFELTDEQLNEALDAAIAKAKSVKDKAQAEIDRVGGQTI